MKSSTLQYLATRLSQFDDAECATAGKLVRNALSSIDVFTQSAEAEHALYHSVWGGHISRALDVGSFTPAQADVLGALETEMAGHTLTIRLSLGWLTRSAMAPQDFPALAAFQN
ncbi:hypothetical protein [Acidovorax sp. sic0104]|uniref:hypothetical protein n=1 Tax=Acidovorax sp. sic0104 TaxID=2854784 RepID=UPI001C4774B5|nr:hypothetical protein [Acidovorax sp. sic0104]MBV7542201.1 hypothetical protein [Acidovorax sp. sic0104]